MYYGIHRLRLGGTSVVCMYAVRSTALEDGPYTEGCFVRSLEPSLYQII